MPIKTRRSSSTLIRSDRKFHRSSLKTLFGLLKTKTKGNCRVDYRINIQRRRSYCGGALDENLFVSPVKGFAAPKSSTTAQMNEYPSPVTRKDGPHEVSRHCTPVRNHRHVMEADAGDPIKCTGKSCQSCTAGLIADCVAICCCPCAVVNILAFAFLKVPWTIGKRVLKMGKKKGRRNSQRMRKCDQKTCLGLDGDFGSMDMDCSARRNGRAELEHCISEFEFSDQFEDEELKNNFGARIEEEEEKLWFELYQVGHLGFGRVSFTGIPSSLCKGN